MNMSTKKGLTNDKEGNKIKSPVQLESKLEGADRG